MRKLDWKVRIEDVVIRSRGRTIVFFWWSVVLIILAASEGSVREARMMREVGFWRARKREVW